MRPSQSLACLVCMFSIWLAACQQQRIETSSSESKSLATPGVVSMDTIFNVPAPFKPDYKILEVEDVSFATASRKVARIALPLGLDHERVNANLRHAAKTIYEREKPDALEVYGYKFGETTNGPYSVGHCTFAPYGQWEKADEKPSIDKYQAVVKLNEVYFNPPQLYSNGTAITLQNKYGEVSISNSDEAWHDENIIAHVPSNTPARIVASKEFPTPAGNPSLIRYRVIAKYKENKYEGWVHDSNVKPQASRK